MDSESILQELYISEKDEADAGMPRAKPSAIAFLTTDSPLSLNLPADQQRKNAHQSITIQSLRACSSIG